MKKPRQRIASVRLDAPIFKQLEAKCKGEGCALNAKLKDLILSDLNPKVEEKEIESRRELEETNGNNPGRSEQNQDSRTEIDKPGWFW